MFKLVLNAEFLPQPRPAEAESALSCSSYVIQMFVEVGEATLQSFPREGLAHGNKFLPQTNYSIAFRLEGEFGQM